MYKLQVLQEAIVTLAYMNMVVWICLVNLQLTSSPVRKRKRRRRQDGRQPPVQHDQISLNTTQDETESTSECRTYRQVLREW